ncbi:hypothetical protein GW17_00015565 [Ensete ventricosum]|nr:hypothetical protein GW17_00015565 [Ensete ventricosum]RZR82153.1 hypothetical protein BHM03_00008517 [Ensete ventricosum]
MEKAINVRRREDARARQLSARRKGGNDCDEAKKMGRWWLRERKRETGEDVSSGAGRARGDASGGGRALWRSGEEGDPVIWLASARFKSGECLDRLMLCPSLCEDACIAHLLSVRLCLTSPRLGA